MADRTAYRVLRDGRPVDLTPKLLDLLFYLVERPATLVTKDALLDGVWPGANVTDNALAQAMSELREALGIAPPSRPTSRTIARRGYRFIAPVVTPAAAIVSAAHLAPASALPVSTETARRDDRRSRLHERDGRSRHRVAGGRYCRNGHE